MLDVAPALAAAAKAFADAAATMGTTVTQTRPQPTSTVDPDTGAATAPSVPVLATGVPAILVPAAVGGQDRVYPGSPVAESPRVTLNLPPTLVDVLRGDHFKVDASRDPRLPGRSFEVTEVGGNAAGVTRTITAIPVPQDGQQ